jgi:hypothetical protein
VNANRYYRRVAVKNLMWVFSQTLLRGSFETLFFFI